MAYHLLFSGQGLLYFAKFLPFFKVDWTRFYKVDWARDTAEL